MIAALDNDECASTNFLDTTDEIDIISLHTQMASQSKHVTKYPCNYAYYAYYEGPAPFSEPETKSVADFVLSRKDDIKVN